MSESNWRYATICHWCGKLYHTTKGRTQARFCSTICKQAHYRAYKKYVTTTAGGCRQPVES